MTERVQKTLTFLNEQFDACRYFKEHPSEKNYRREHSIRVARICAYIAQAEGMDEEAAMIAGLLHDIGYGQDFPADYDWKSHGRDGAGIARPFLATLSLDAQTVEDICYAIAIHVDDKADFEGRRIPFTETIGDADNIDRFDAWRIYESVRYQACLEEKDLPEKLEWIQERLERLEKLSKLEFATQTATSMWRDKVAFQAQFFGRLLEQMELSCLPEEMED